MKITNDLNSLNKYFFENKKIILFFTLFFISILLFNIFIYISVDSFIRKNDEENLLKNVSLIESFLEEKKQQVSNYAKLLARFPDLQNINNDNLLKRRVYNLHSSLNVKGIQIFDNNLNQIFEIGAGYELEKESQLAESIIKVVKDGYSVAFFSENDSFDIQITSYSYIYDEYSIEIEGLVSISESIKKDTINRIAYDIGGVINFYTVTELNKDFFDNFNKKRSISGKAYYLKEQKIDKENYLLSYLPVNDFYNNPIGYYTILVSESSRRSLVWQLTAINLVLFLFLLSLLVYYQKIK